MCGVLVCQMELSNNKATYSTKPKQSLLAWPMSGNEFTFELSMGDVVVIHEQWVTSPQRSNPKHFIKLNERLLVSKPRTWFPLLLGQQDMACMHNT